MAADTPREECVQKFRRYCNPARPPPLRNPHNVWHTKQCCPPHPGFSPDIRARTPAPFHFPETDLHPRLQSSVPSVHRARYLPSVKMSSALQLRRLPSRQYARPVPPPVDPTWTPLPGGLGKLCGTRELRPIQKAGVCVSAIFQRPSVGIDWPLQHCPDCKVNQLLPRRPSRPNQFARFRGRLARQWSIAPTARLSPPPSSALEDHRRGVRSTACPILTALAFRETASLPSEFAPCKPFQSILHQPKP